MQVFHTIKELHAWRKDKDSVALVPTMGNLHEGHIQLVREAKKSAEYVVVSIFVNPIQFGEGEDFSSYPRTLVADLEKLAKEGVSAIFVPEVKELYPVPQTVFVELPALQNELCGASRPGHFRGAATVVNKLFNIIQPNIACFGKKDYQQLFLIKQMVANFNLPIHIIDVATERAQDGLALSSRNGYLTAEERLQAPELHNKLVELQQSIKAGERDYLSLTAQATQQLNAQCWQVDYIEIRSANTLKPAQTEDKNLVILVAARLGKPRLIDNIEISI